MDGNQNHTTSAAINMPVIHCAGRSVPNKWRPFTSALAKACALHTRRLGASSCSTCHTDADYKWSLHFQ